MVIESYTVDKHIELSFKFSLEFLSYPLRTYTFLTCVHVTTAKPKHKTSLKICPQENIVLLVLDKVRIIHSEDNCKGILKADPVRNSVTLV